MLNIFVTRPAYAEEFVKLARGVLDSQEQIEAGITKLEDGDYVIRALGYRAQSLEKISELLLQDLGKIHDKINYMDQPPLKSLVHNITLM